VKKDFLTYQAQTSPNPLSLEISRAEGSYVYDTKGNSYLDFIAGVSANTLGHGHPKVSAAIKAQVAQYTHVMVYGEYIQEKPLALCKLLVENLPSSLQTVYLTNSGTEAVEGALKLAKRATGRQEIIYADKAYHGNTQGAMSVSGQERQKNAFRPLIPGAKCLPYNDLNALSRISEKTAAVILETIQGGAGFIVPKNNYLAEVAARCKKMGTLLILDEIQSGIGRTGKLFGCEHYGVVPDVLVTGKGLGGGMPIGAFITSHSLMACLQQQPALGHITTFGGHPVMAAAALATLRELLSGHLIADSLVKEQLFRNHLQHPLITEIRGKGLMLALMLPSPELASKVILACLSKGLLLFWLLFEGRAVRITPPLTISETEIQQGCEIILQVLDKIKK